MLIDDSATPVEDASDFVVVGSGAGGATVARWLAQAGHSVIVVEEGPPAVPQSGDAKEALGALYRDAGACAAIGRDVLPLLQGRCVGGTTVINGGIQVPFPKHVWDEWVAQEPRWSHWLPWERLEAARVRMDRELEVAPTPVSLWGGNGASLRRGLPAFTEPTRRNTPGCRGSGRCLQGCPHGGKTSMDRSMLARAQKDGARVYARCKVDRVRIRKRAESVAGRFASGASFTAHARRAVILAAGAIHTPWLLLRSGIRSAGKNFRCHPGAALAGVFERPLDPGATQSMESLAFLDRGFKLESLGMPRAFKAARVPGIGPLLQQRLSRLENVALWGVAARAEAVGRVTRGPFGPLVWYSLTSNDRRKLLAGLAVLAEAMLEAGAEALWPAVHGAPEEITKIEAARALADLPPAPGAIPMVATHLFGGAPVGERFQVADVPGLVVADASLFPTSLGVNPMSAITAVATRVAEIWA